MKDIETLTTDLFYCDPQTHLFVKCRKIGEKFDKKILGLYGLKLDSCNIKIRFAATALNNIKQIVKELEHGEFIYFDDENRLKLSFYTESFLIFIRTTLDLAVSSYYLYLTGDTTLHSINDFLKKIKKDNSFLPNDSKDFWNKILNDYEREDHYTWIHALVGRERGSSLRDIAVHKSRVEIETYIDEKDRGKFYIILLGNQEGHPVPFFGNIFSQCSHIIDKVINDICFLESSIQGNG